MLSCPSTCELFAPSQRSPPMNRLLLSAVLSVLVSGSAVATDSGHAVYRPGLTQARIPFPSAMGYLTAYDGVPNLASNLLANADASWLDRTLDVFKDGEHSNNATNPVSGKAWPWLIEHNHGVFAYEGEIFVEEGIEYSFYGRSDTGEALVVDGETVVWQGVNRGWQVGPEIHRRWTAPKTGWVPFNGWLWTWNGIYGTQWSEWSLQYNLQGVVVTFLDPSDRLSDRSESLNAWLEANRGLTNVWQRFADTGDGTFLRTVTGERFTTVGASAAVEGGRSFELSFSGVPTNATLVAFTGPFDGGHATSEWATVSASLAQVPAGHSTRTVNVPLAADARVLRFRLKTESDIPADGLHPFEEWTEMIAVSPSPVVRLDSVSAGYTNVVVAGTLGSFGLDGASGTVTVEIATADDASFASPVLSANLPAVSAVGPFSAELFGLATNTAYLVRATLLNDRNVSGGSAAVAFRTAEPGPAAAALAVKVAAFQSATLVATVSDWGGGSRDATAWIDVSADGTFPAAATQTLGPLPLSGRLPATATATAAGLAPATGYHARVRAVNSWGLETVSETVPFTTASVPISFPAPTATPGKNAASVTLSPTFVAEGTEYDVLLKVENRTGVLGRWRGQSGFGESPFSGSLAALAGEEIVFLYTIDWRYGEREGRIELRAAATAKLADTELDALPKIDPAYEDAEWHGVYLRPGDTVAIAPSAGARIDWHTNAVLRITPTNDVFVLEALEPGATLLYETDLATGATNNVTGVAIVLPEKDPAGGIYIHRALNSFSWTDPKEWEIVAPGPKTYPDAAGALAYIVTPAQHVYHGLGGTVDLTEEISLGGLVVGQLGWIHHDFNSWSQAAWSFTDQTGAGGAFRFDSGDPNVASWIRLAGHCHVVSTVKMEVPIVAANDLDLDAMSRIPDSNGWKSWRDHGFKFHAPVDFGPFTFRTIRDTYYYGRWNLYSRGFITINDDIRGSGTIRLEADTAVGMNDGSDAARFKSFTGVWDVANGQFNTTGYGGCGLFFGDACLGNASEIIFRGAWHPADASENKGAHSRSGYSGESVWTNDWRDILPSKVTLDGGWIFLGTRGGTMSAAAKTAYQATGIRRAYFQIRDLVIPAGPQGRLETAKYGSSVDYPHNIVEITNLVMDANAVLSFSLGDSSEIVSNEVFILNEPPSFYEDPDGSGQFLPQLYANHEANDNNQLIFRHPATGHLSRRTAGTGDNDAFRRWTAAATLADGAQYASMQLGANTTLSFADGATARNLAGFLDLRGGASLGRVGTDAGATLDFGSAVARVYVGKRADTATIGCRLSGMAGLVKGGSGTLQLGASAEGVKGGIRIAGGTLALGAPDAGGRMHVARVAGDVVVEAGSRLVVRGGNPFEKDVRLFLNDREWIPSHAHVRVESDAIVPWLFVGGKALERGTWGSSASAAENVDDVHFDGPGILTVGIPPTMMILR